MTVSTLAAALVIQSGPEADLQRLALLYGPAVMPSVPDSTLRVKTPEAELKRTVASLFELIEKPDPRSAAFVTITDRTRLLAVETKGDGSSDIVLDLLGEAQVEAALDSLLRRPDDVRIELGTAAVHIDGSFGQLTTELVAYEGQRPPPRHLFRFDALRDKNGWWTFTQIIIHWRDDWWKEAHR